MCDGIPAAGNNMSECLKPDPFSHHMDLFPGELLALTDTESDNEARLSDELINQKYIKGDVRIVTEQARYPLSSVPSMVQSQDYELNPEFQRRHRWDNLKKSRLIESFIMNVPIPPIFLYEDRFSHYEVMDGLQRMTAIYEFYTDRFSLEGLEEWPELNGRLYSDLPEQIKRGIDRRYLSSIILLQETAKDETEATRLKQLVFERINSGGIKLEPQESRNAIYNGPLNKMCIRLARTPALCLMWGIPAPTEVELHESVLSDELLANETFRKMDDVELVLRFFAYRQRLKHPEGSLKDYLDQYLKSGNLYSSEVLAQLEQLFVRTVDLVHDILGEKAFWLWRRRKVSGWGWFARPTTVLYDPIMYVFSRYVDQASELSDKSEVIRSGITDFYEKHYDQFEGRYTNISNIVERNRLFDELLAKTLSA
ncbi:conserved hypothetical protein [Cyanobium sp. PCC 7001]|nr:conserved hypothetical protein [Cyanobium sp. PCC 7001]